MQIETSSIQFTDAAVINYINEIKKELTTQFEHQICKLKEELLDYKNKYLLVKEERDLLIYKRYMRSSEQLPIDEKQQLLFTTEAKTNQAATVEKHEESTTVKSYSRKKRGRKPIDPSIPRIKRIIDISEDEKTCACGAKLTQIGMETS